MTALHTAVQSGQNESVEILIKVGKANVNQSTKDGTVRGFLFFLLKIYFVITYFVFARRPLCISQL